MSKCNSIQSKDGNHQFIDGTTACCNCGYSWIKHLQGEVKELEEDKAEFNRVINYALELEDFQLIFLELWREGAWQELNREFPEWKKEKNT